MTTLDTAMSNHLDCFLEMMEAERGIALNTVSSYQNDINDLLSFLKKENIELSKVNYQNFLDFVTFIKLKGLDPRSIRRKISSCRQFFDFLISEKVIELNPTLNIPMPKKDKLLPKALSTEIIAKLLEFAGKDQTKEGIRTYAMLEILYSTGMRISELISLKYKLTRNIDLTKMNYLLIKGKGSKERVVIMNKCSTEALKKYLSVRNEFIKNNKTSVWLFPSQDKSGKIQHITRQRFGQILKNIAVVLNIEPDIVSPHKIRHSFATHMLENGANLRVLQELLGHSDITSTQIYTKISDITAKNLILSKHPLAKT